MPADVALQPGYFTVLDQGAKEEDEIMVVRIDAEGEGEGGDGGEKIEVQYFPQPIDLVAMAMCTNGDSMFDERAQCYQATCSRTGRKDRSKAGPVGVEGWVGNWLGTWETGKGPAGRNDRPRRRERCLCD
jgi:hypothetical protein